MNPVVRSALCAACIACALVSGASEGSEAAYVYVGGDGEVHLTNVPGDERYRKVEGLWGGNGHDATGRRAEGPPYASIVAAAARRYGVDAALLHAVIAVESGYNVRAVSPRGAAGLMQLMPGTARRLGVADVFDAAENVHAGARHLMELLQLFGGDLRLALAAYNAGEAAVVRHGRRIPPYRETAAYVPKVVRLYRQFRSSM